MRLLLLFLIYPLAVSGQQKPQVIKNGDVLFRYNPSGLLDFTDVNITFGAEKRINHNVGLGGDVGFIPYSHRYINSRHSFGFLIRPSVRWYPRSKLFYLETEFEYRWIMHRIEDWIGRGVVERVPSYEEFTSFRYRRSVLGVYLKAGRIRGLSAHNSQWWWEVYGGLGIRRHMFRLINQPGSSYESFNIWGLPHQTDTYYSLALPLGVKLIYMIPQK